MKVVTGLGKGAKRQGIPGSAEGKRAQFQEGHTEVTATLSFSAFP